MAFAALTKNRINKNLYKITIEKSSREPTNSPRSCVFFWMSVKQIKYAEINSHISPFIFIDEL